MKGSTTRGRLKILDFWYSVAVALSDLLLFGAKNLIGYTISSTGFHSGFTCTRTSEAQVSSIFCISRFSISMLEDRGSYNSSPSFYLRNY